MRTYHRKKGLKCEGCGSVTFMVVRSGKGIIDIYRCMRCGREVEVMVSLFDTIHEYGTILIFDR